MPQLGFDVFAASGWKEFTKRQLMCGSYGHIENKYFSHICLQCRVGKGLDGSVVAMTDVQRNCVHEWEDVSKSCSLCWAKRVDEEVSNGSKG